MVDEDEDLIFAVFQVVIPIFKCFNNSQEFLIVGFIVGLSRDHFSRKIGYRGPLITFNWWVRLIVRFIGHLTY